MLKIEIALTDECNLGCKYCYVKNKKIKININRIYDFFIHDLSKILIQYGETDYSVSLFGGEPLLAWDIAEETVNIFKMDPNCRYVVIVSNLSLLTPRIFEKIKEKNIGVSWSCDGISSTRPFLDRRNAVDVYLEKRDMITSLTRTVKSMVSPQNIDDMAKNAQWFKDYGMLTIDQQYLFDDVWTDADIDRYAAALYELAEWWEDNQDIDLKLFTNVYRLHKYGANKSSPCFAGVNGICLSADGEIYPCQRYAQTKEHGTRIFNSSICKNCPLDGKCSVGCSYTIEHHGQPKGICELHKITHKIAFEFLKNQKLKNSFMVSHR